MRDRPDLRRQYPSLFTHGVWGPVRVQFVLSDQLPTDLAISNVNIVPFVGDRVIVLRLSNGMVEMPDGTLEPAEDYLQAARRELLEEAGAVPSSFRPIGYWRCFSSAPTPFRPHIPHPEYARLVGVSEVARVGPPSNPPGGEDVIAVEMLSLNEAADQFATHHRPDVAELYRLAASLRRGAD